MLEVIVPECEYFERWHLWGFQQGPPTSGACQICYVDTNENELYDNTIGIGDEFEVKENNGGDPP